MTPTSESPSSFARHKLAEGCETLVALLHGLLDSQNDIAAEVHAIRKLGKSLRGGFSLFRMKKPAREIQAIGRLLSEPRDAVSRLKTWNLLDWKAEPATASAIGDLLEQLTHSAARRPPRTTVDWCVARVTSAREALSNMTEEELDSSMASGIAKLSKQVRKRCLRLDPENAEAFHDARKALKAYLGAVAFLPAESSSPTAPMEDIAELLGDENDLATLAHWLERHGFTPPFAPDLWKQLSSTRHKLQKRAIHKASKLFLHPAH